MRSNLSLILVAEGQFGRMASLRAVAELMVASGPTPLRGEAGLATRLGIAKLQP